MKIKTIPQERIKCNLQLFVIHLHCSCFERSKKTPIFPVPAVNCRLCNKLIRWALSGAINLFPGQRATPPAGFVVHCLMNGRQISAPLFRDKTLLGGSCFSARLPSIFLPFWGTKHN